MPGYRIREDGALIRSGFNTPSLGFAVDVAIQSLIVLPEGEQATFSVHNEFEILVASVTNRRIIGAFYKQELRGSNGTDVFCVGIKQFDATDSVLRMGITELHSVDDYDDTSDNIGMKHVEWSGPFKVEIVDSIRAFFGVDEICDISSDALLFAQSTRRPDGREPYNMPTGANMSASLGAPW